MKASSFVVTESPLEPKLYKPSSMTNGVYKINSSYYPHARIVVADSIKLFVDIFLSKVELLSTNCWDKYDFVKTNEKIELTLKFE
jgi:hypothetical protein